MKPTETLIKNLDIFYRSETVPKVKIGDTVRVTIFLELQAVFGKHPSNNAIFQYKLPKNSNFNI